MTARPEGNAIVYCEAAFNTLNGKTAHGLVRFTRRYRILSVIDSCFAGKDAGEVLDGKPCGIPVVPSLEKALEAAHKGPHPATHLVVGIAPDGGRLSQRARRDIKAALKCGLNVDSGLHDFLSDDPQMVELAAGSGAVIRDVRKSPSRSTLHFFSGRIERVAALKIAVLGTDSAVGKRTTAWLIATGFEKIGLSSVMVGTGQTAWMQGASYGVIMDSLINDFVSGEIEHAVYSAWTAEKPDVIVIEGQGSLMNPAYPGGFEILAAGRPDLIVLQHAPARIEYDGFPGYRLHPLSHQIRVVEMLSGKSVVAVTINHENLARDRIPAVCDAVQSVCGLPAFDVLRDGAAELVQLLKTHLKIGK